MEEADKLANGGWSGLRGKNVCLPGGYYITTEFVDDYGMKLVETVDTSEARMKLAAGLYLHSIVFYIFRDIQNA